MFSEGDRGLGVGEGSVLSRKDVFKRRCMGNLRSAFRVETRVLPLCTTTHVTRIQYSHNSYITTTLY